MYKKINHRGTTDVYEICLIRRIRYFNNLYNLINDHFKVPRNLLYLFVPEKLERLYFYCYLHAMTPALKKLLGVLLAVKSLLYQENISSYHMIEVNKKRLHSYRWSLRYLLRWGYHKHTQIRYRTACSENLTRTASSNSASGNYQAIKVIKNDFVRKLPKRSYINNSYVDILHISQCLCSLTLFR